MVTKGAPKIEAHGLGFYAVHLRQVENFQERGQQQAQGLMGLFVPALPRPEIQVAYSVLCGHGAS
jgi:hypothetical protein